MARTPRRLEDTEIPALRKHFEGLAAEARRRAEKELAAKALHFINAAGSALTNLVRRSQSLSQSLYYCLAFINKSDKSDQHGRSARVTCCLAGHRRVRRGC